MSAVIYRNILKLRPYSIELQANGAHMNQSLSTDDFLRTVVFRDTDFFLLFFFRYFEVLLSDLELYQRGTDFKGSISCFLCLTFNRPA